MKGLTPELFDCAFCVGKRKEKNSKFGRLDLARDCPDRTLEPLKLWAEYAVVDERLDSGASSCCN